MPSHCIEFRGVGKRYGRQTVLDGVDLEVREGEFLGLVGTNGAGKTTLLKCLLDLASVEGGEILIRGRPHDRPSSRADLVYLPEKFTPPYYLTGREFLAYMARLHGGAGGGTEEMLKTLDFDPAGLAKPVRQLSKGMSQKLGLAACLLSGRRLLVLDEPMSGLDPQVRASLRRHLLSMKGGGRTVFFSTHLLTDVEALCDRVAILHRGRIPYAGTVADCRDRYRAGDFETAYLNCIGSDPGTGDGTRS